MRVPKRSETGVTRYAHPRDRLRDAFQGRRCGNGGGCGGARLLLTQAVEAEVADFVAKQLAAPVTAGEGLLASGVSPLGS